MTEQVIPMREPHYDILLDDADGKTLWLESQHDFETARQRLPQLSAVYPGMRLLLWHRKSQRVLAATEGY
jgi:hypothetical protein